MRWSGLREIETPGRPSAQETVSVESDASDPPVLRRRRGGAGDGRKTDTQARILEAAVALFAARGYERTSISAIATRAGVSRAALGLKRSDRLHFEPIAECGAALLPPFRKPAVFQF